MVFDPEPDQPPGAWRTYRACLERVPADATHQLVIQDDTVVCDRFEEALAAAVAARPSTVLALWHGGQPRENLPALAAALDAGDAWAALGSARWVPTVALVWPAGLIRPVLDWVAEQDWPARYSADDEIVGHALRALGRWPLACVPSLVEHPDEVESLLGLRAWAGHDPARVAAYWIGDRDPLGLDWHSGAR